MLKILIQVLTEVGRWQNQESTPSVSYFKVYSLHSVASLSSIFYIGLSPGCMFNIILWVFFTFPDKEIFQVPGLSVTYLTSTVKNLELKDTFVSG